jgi:hypothetical protein
MGQGKNFGGEMKKNKTKAEWITPEAVARGHPLDLSLSSLPTYYPPAS